MGYPRLPSALLDAMIVKNADVIIARILRDIKPL